MPSYARKYAQRPVPLRCRAADHGVVGRRQITETAVGPDGVVVEPPFGQSRSGMRERAEQRLVQQFVAQSAVEAFDERVLRRFAGRDVMPVDPGLLAPAQDRHARELGAIVGDAVQRLAALGDDRVELTRDPQARERRIGDQCQALARKIVDDGEDAETATVAQRVAQKIERPALVWSLRHQQRCPGAERPFATATTADLETLRGIKTPQLLVVHVQAFAVKQDVEAAIAEASAYSGQLAQPSADRSIVRPPAPVANRTAIDADCAAPPPPAHREDLRHVSRGLPSDGRRHPFFAAMSFSNPLSRLASASSFFSREFSSSSAFSRRASETSIPPNLPFHL